MKKFLLPLVVVAFLANLSLSSCGQTTDSLTLKLDQVKLDNLAYYKGSSVVSVGVGVPNMMQVIGSLILPLTLAKDYETSGKGPFYLRYDYGLGRKISIGVSVARVSATFTRYYDSALGFGSSSPKYYQSLTVRNLAVLARTNIHFGHYRMVDPYLGVAAGWNFYDVKEKSDDPDRNTDDPGLTVYDGLAIELVFGTRFFFNKHFGAYTELGWGKSLLQAGILGKF